MSKLVTTVMLYNLLQMYHKTTSLPNCLLFITSVQFFDFSMFPFSILSFFVNKVPNSKQTTPKIFEDHAKLTMFGKALAEAEVGHDEY